MATMRKAKKGRKICREIEIQFGVIFAPFFRRGESKKSLNDCKESAKGGNFPLHFPR
jgi:hypothetical protein